MSRSVTSDHFRINYKMNHSTQSTKAELKSSAIRISTAQGKANAMQRGSSASIKTFYHQIASTNQVFRLKPDQTPTQQRPVSQYGSIKPREFKLNSKFDQSSTSEIKSSSNLRLVNSQLNEHFGKHFGRNYRSLKRIKQHPSVDCHQKIPSTDLVGYSQKKEPKITVTSSKSRLADNLSNEIKSEEESEQVVYMDEEAEPDKAQTLRDELYRDAPACLGRQIESLERCQQIFGVLEEAEEKSKQRLKEERMRELKYKAFTGNYKDFEPAYPWEAVSHYLPEEPEFNSVTSTAVYKREPLLSVSEKDELEIAKLMEDLNDKYEFFLKHTHMEYDSDYAFIKGDPAKMTHIEIDFLKRQYDSKSTGGSFDLERIEVLLRPLMFFKKFDKEIRDSIIKKGELNCYPAGHVVFKQGSYGDKMYIILRGSVNVIINYTDPMTSLPQSKVVAWMKDGSSFGEYAMLGSKTRGIKESILSTIARVTNDIQKRVTYLKRAIVYNQQIDLKANNPIIEEKKKKQEEEALLKSGKTSNYQERTKRAADIVATEDLLMLELSREFFREIILNTIKDEYERKMRLISELPFFKAHELLSLMPIVNFLQKRTYKMGENIQLQGTKMDGFSIICKGRCKVINILYHKRTNELTHKVRGLKGKLPNMYFGDRERQSTNEIEDLGFVKLQKEHAKKREKQKFNRQFSFTEIEELNDKDPKHCHYQDNYLERGSIFGLRALKSQQMKMDEGYQVTENVPEPARLTIIAETNDVLVYSFDIKNFVYLTEDLKKTLVGTAFSTLDFDEENVDEYRKGGDKWDVYKQELYRVTLDRQFNLRRGDDFKAY